MWQALCLAMVVQIFKKKSRKAIQLGLKEGTSTGFADQPDPDPRAKEESVITGSLAEDPTGSASHHRGGPWVKKMFMSLDSNTLRCRYSDEEVQEAVVFEGKSALKFKKSVFITVIYWLVPVLRTGAHFTCGGPDAAVCALFPAELELTRD